MSNRPVRLKCLKPKMKIILCIFLLYITAVSVFGRSVELNGIVGEGIEFPAAVKKDGFLMYGTLFIGDVTSGKFGTARNGKYSGRLQWDSSTGLFSLSGLKMEDIGEYKVHNTDQNITVFQLNVYIPVSKPHVSITHNEYPCTIECTAERGTGATLSWYREGEKKSFVSSRVEGAQRQCLSLSVERSVTYTCKANNSVSNETSDPLTVGDHCTAPSDPIKWILIAVVLLLLAIVTYFLWPRFCRNRSKHPTKDGDAVQAVPQSVEELLGSVDPPAYVEELLGSVDPPAYGDAVQAVPQSGNRKEIRGFIRRCPRFLIRCLRLEEMVNLTSSHQTEVPLNQATCEVGEP